MVSYKINLGEDKFQITMENKQIIPNVSCVFRQLVQLSHTNPRLHSSQQNQPYTVNSNSNNQFSYQQSRNNQQIDLISNMGIDDRQKKHQQLMNRFKSSLEENRQILGINQSPMQTDSTSHYQAYNPVSSQFNRPSNQNYLNTNSYQRPNNQLQPKGWSAPRIKYRHIQDFQQKPPTMPNQFDQLKKEFYESNFSNQNLQTKQQQNQNENKKSYTHIQDEQDDDQSPNEENINKISRLSDQPSKYNENLESYYEICRKPIKPSLIKQKSNINAQSKVSNQKFMRKHAHKVEGINIQKAMRILSLDD